MGCEKWSTGKDDCKFSSLNGETNQVITSGDRHAVRGSGLGERCKEQGCDISSREQLHITQKWRMNAALLCYWGKGRGRPLCSMPSPLHLIEWCWIISYKKLTYADRCPTPILWLLSNPCLVPACLITGLNLLFSYSLKENTVWSYSRFFLELCTNSLCHQTGNEF